MQECLEYEQQEVGLKLTTQMESWLWFTLYAMKGRGDGIMTEGREPQHSS